MEAPQPYGLNDLFPHALGADANQYGVLQGKRLAQLKTMDTEEIKTVFYNMQSATRVPGKRYHFERHGADMRASTEQQYEQLFLEHIQKQGLTTFTSLRTKDEKRIWHQLDIETGFVSEYNESDGRYHSFYLPRK